MASQNSKPAKKTLSSCSNYIKYWDIVIKQWLQNRFAYNELKEQARFASDLGFDVDSISNRLPEPYWGDPDSCSFVIMNYNPGPCNDSRHNYRFCADTCNCMIHEVKNKKYSGFAKSFPLLRDLNSTELWFEDSIGRVWWQKQNNKWIKGLLDKLYHERKEFLKLPFAMELSAWHSSHWNGINEKNFARHKKLIEDTIIVPFKDIIMESDFKLGLCFGKRIGTEFLDRFIPNIFTKVARDINYNIYSFDNNYFIINYWDNVNYRNRYPHNVNDIISILRNHGIIY